MDHNVLILSTNLLMNTGLFLLVAKLYIIPNIGKWQPKNVLLPILILESSRHLGLMFLASGTVKEDMPALFAYTAAFGDLAASLLALICIVALLKGSRAIRPLLWGLTIFGTLDFLVAIVLATIAGAPAYMGASWWIPAFWVPAALVGHYITFVMLRKKVALA